MSETLFPTLLLRERSFHEWVAPHSLTKSPTH